MVSLYRDFEESVRRVSGMLSAVQRLDVRPVRGSDLEPARVIVSFMLSRQSPTSMERGLIHGDDIP